MGSLKGEGALLLIALAVRVLLLWLGSHEWLGQRIEVSTPVGQWKRSRVALVMMCNCS